MIDEASKEDFVEEVKEEYEEIRDEHYDSLKVRRLLRADIVDLVNVEQYFEYSASIQPSSFDLFIWWILMLLLERNITF